MPVDSEENRYKLMQQLIDGYLFTDDQALILSKAAEVHAFMQQAYWTKDRTEAATRAGLVHSWNFALFEPGTERLVGFARVISDYATMYYLSDVFVAPDCRGRGLGRAMLHWIAEEDPRRKRILRAFRF